MTMASNYCQSDDEKVKGQLQKHLARSILEEMEFKFVQVKERDQNSNVFSNLIFFL